MNETSPLQTAVPATRVRPEAAPSLADVVVGASALAVAATAALGRRVGVVLEPVAAVVLSPPLLPRRLRPARLFDPLARRGAEQRASAREDVSRRLDALAPAVAAGLLRRVDVSELLTEYVDLDALVAAVLDRIDLVALATEVIDDIDLPEIIRESTGSMASDTVRGARMRGIAADEAVTAIRERLLRRGRTSPTQVGELRPR